MGSRELVGYDYIAAGLGVQTETARIYALKRNRKRFPDYPRRVNRGQRSPLFRRADADRFIANHRPHDMRDRVSVFPDGSMVDPIWLNFAKLVDYSYIADRLAVSRKTAYVYGTPTSSRYLPGFPAPVTPRQARTPLFDKAEIDEFIDNRIAAARRTRGRIRAAAIRDDVAAAAEQAAAALGRPVDLENRAQLRRILFTDLALPATAPTTRGPTVATAALRQLYATQPHPFLGHVLRYRGIDVDMPPTGGTAD